MRLSLFTLVASLAFVATADYNFSGGRGIECTGHDDGSISCVDSTDKAAAHNNKPESLRLDSRAIKEYGLKDMSPVGRAASPLEARELEERATCELFGDKGCFTHCFAVGYCHSHCSSDNICICTCKDTWYGVCLGTATCQ